MVATVSETPTEEEPKGAVAVEEKMKHDEKCEALGKQAKRVA